MVASVSNTDSIRFWSNSLYINVTQGSANVQIEGPTSNSGGTGTVFVANTLFVDSVYGTTMGQRENMNMPFDTIQNAFLASQANDTIYVRAGTHIINSNITSPNPGASTFFFESNTDITLNGLFPSNTSILGFGNFTCNTTFANNLLIAEAENITMNSGSVSIGTHVIVKNQILLTSTSSNIGDLSGTTGKYVIFNILTSNTTILQMGIDRSSVIKLKGNYMEGNMLFDTFAEIFIDVVSINGCQFNLDDIGATSSNTFYINVLNDFINPNPMSNITIIVIRNALGVIQIGGFASGSIVVYTQPIVPAFTTTNRSIIRIGSIEYGYLQLYNCDAVVGKVAGYCAILGQSSAIIQTIQEIADFGTDNDLLIIFGSQSSNSEYINHSYIGSVEIPNNNVNIQNAYVKLGNVNASLFNSSSNFEQETVLDIQRYRCSGNNIMFRLGESATDGNNSKMILNLGIAHSDTALFGFVLQGYNTTYHININRVELTTTNSILFNVNNTGSIAYISGYGKSDSYSLFVNPGTGTFTFIPKNITFISNQSNAIYHSAGTFNLQYQGDLTTNSSTIPPGTITVVGNASQHLSYDTGFN